MGTETNKAYLAKKKPTDGIYNELYLEGMELLQKLSGEEWTDYNEHDPGVTILENLSYTLSSLSYKTELPIQNILTESKGEPLTSGDNGFFIASDILTTNPVTLKDFSKTFIDKITNVKNVWVRTEDVVTQTLEYGTQPTLKGLYHIAVELYNYPIDLEALTAEKKRIIAAVENLYHASRNLCEDVYGVVVLEPYKLHLEVRLTLDSEVNADEVFANVYFVINNHITHDVRFYSLWDLQNKNQDINSIFNGPNLENGFIPDGELKDRVSKIIPSEVIKLISEVKGVISVDYFMLSHTATPKNENDAVIETDAIVIPKHTAPVLSFPETNTDWVYQAKGVTFSPDLNEVQKQLAYIKAMNYGNFKSVSQALNSIEIPRGTNLDIASYYSVREQFPYVYGIGEYGLQKGLPPLRYAQANQLKAYLLPFDQLMANFLAQLTHLYQLYDVHGNHIQSYFYQELDDMPKLLHLIKKNDFLSEDDILDGWEKTLGELNARFDRNALERLNVVANSLLARFSEEFPAYALRNINEGAYGKKMNNDDFEKRLLHLKRKLVANYGYLSYNRAKSFDYTHEALSVKEATEKQETKLAPPIIEKTTILLGIKNFGLGPIYKTMEDSGLQILKKEEGLQFISQELDVLFPDGAEDVSTLEDFIIIQDEMIDLYGAFYFMGNEATILEKTMKHGVLEDNYQIKTLRRGSKTLYCILFTEARKTRVVHIAESLELAQAAIDRAVGFLVDLSEKCEGIYLIEHLLLAPPYQDDHFGFTINLSLNGKTYKFDQLALKCYRTRNKELNALIQHLNAKQTIVFKVAGKDGKLHLQILNEAGEPWAKSTKVYHETATAEEAITELNKELSLNTQGSSVANITYYAHYGRHCVDETFFSFQMSFVLPSWPVRFQDSNFRIKFNNVIRGQVPVHITYYGYWIKLEQMAAFEKSYYNWLQLLTNSRSSHDYLDACYDLILKVKAYSENSEI
ncbi:MAG: hypothetical protein AAGB24_00165 [Bacteroidota bacterium]